MNTVIFINFMVHTAKIIMKVIYRKIKNKIEHLNYDHYGFRRNT